MAIRYRSDVALSVDQFIDILRRSSLAERRPVDDRDCIAAMVEGADLTVTAWDGELLVGVARSVTDFAYCCYLSDLAVSTSHQRMGIGLELQRQTQASLGPRCTVILLAAPAAAAYYPRIGMQRHESCWIAPPGRQLGQPLNP
ncbi:MAG: GNAT family N-acetyltransferase [Planctomycetota bacterium]